MGQEYLVKGFIKRNKAYLSIHIFRVARIVILCKQLSKGGPLILYLVGSE